MLSSKGLLSQKIGASGDGHFLSTWAEQSSLALRLRKPLSFQQIRSSLWDLDCQRDAHLAQPSWIGFL